MLYEGWYGAVALPVGDPIREEILGSGELCSEADA